MPRPQGRFTYDAALQRFRNAQSGALVADAAILPPAGPTVSADDALEMIHDGHVAGASTPGWLRDMKGGLKQPCETCGLTIGLADVTLTSEHTRDWGKAR